MQLKELENDHSSPSLLKPSPNLEVLLNQFSNATYTENMSLSNMTLMLSMTKKISHKNKPLSLFHVNTCSFNKVFDNLQYLLISTKNFLDIIAVKLDSQNKYLHNHLSYKRCSDLRIYKKWTGI